MIKATHAAFAALLAVATTASAQVIHFPMEATDGSDFMEVSAQISNGSGGFVVDDDVRIERGVDYRTFEVAPFSIGGPFEASIPEAPNTQPGDAATTGHIIYANEFSPPRIAKVAMVAMDPSNPSQPLTTTGNYEVQLDIWMNYPAGSGTATEFGGMVVGHDTVSPGNLSGGGFSFSGDSGAAADFYLTKGPNVDPFTIPDINSGVARQTINGPGKPGEEGPFDGPFDGQYNPAITEAYAADDQFDSGSFNANDNENDFWQEAFPLRNDTSASFSPIGGQGPSQGDPTGVNNPPGDPGFRWVTVRMEVEPNTVGNGSRAAAGIADVYVQGTYLDLVDDDEDPETPDVQMQLQGPEVFVGTIDNSIDRVDAFRGASNGDAGFTPEVIDFNGPIAFVYEDLFASLDFTGYVFGAFDNLIVTLDGGSEPIEGDFNGDGTVDNTDLNLLLNNWGEPVASVDPAWVNGLLAPGVDNEELNALLNNWGFGTGSTVPEPTTLAVALLAAAGLATRRR
ncbi:MAG: PEP-CTERM sorting domain-containing protein [Planctomycetota bacterium]